jgi:catechol 2,3-dioxygenase-like lactoylglutathione lyase family enzyme
MDSKQGICFLPSRDLERSRGFFEGLGVTVEDVTPFACVLRAGSVMVRVTRVEEYQPQPFTVFGWQVDDVASVVERLSAQGVVLLRYEGLEQDSDGVWTTPDGSKVAWFHDPDGNVLSLTQFAS